MRRGYIHSSHEVTNVTVANRAAGVPLGLEVDVAQPESVLADDAIHAAVSGAADVLLLAVVTTVSHGPQHVDYGLLEELRR